MRDDLQRAFSFEQIERVERAEEQRAQLDRVSDALAPKIVSWALARVGREFVSSELHEAVGGAPASADRVLRDLRKRGVLGYELVNRARALYRLTFVRPDRLDAPRKKTKREQLAERRARLLERVAEIDAALAAEGEAA